MEMKCGTCDKKIRTGVMRSYGWCDSCKFYVCVECYKGFFGPCPKCRNRMANSFDPILLGKIAISGFIVIVIIYLFAIIFAVGNADPPLDSYDLNSRISQEGRISEKENYLIWGTGHPDNIIWHYPDSFELILEETTMNVTVTENTNFNVENAKPVIDEENARYNYSFIPGNIIKVYGVVRENDTQEKYLEANQIDYVRSTEYKMSLAGTILMIGGLILIPTATLTAGILQIKYGRKRMRLHEENKQKYEEYKMFHKDGRSKSNE